MPSLAPGTEIGRYRIVSLLGAGGMGEVYRARDLRLGRDVALKLLPDNFAADAERRARFEREARALAAVSHPGIAAIHGLEEEGDRWFLVLELVPGRDLAARLGEGPLGIEESIAFGLRVADALAAAHREGIVHRDLKPANVMLDDSGRIRILDFGLAKPVAASGIRRPGSSLSPTIPEALTEDGMILGTVTTMSPEQARGREVDERTDVWAFGCILFECLAGRPAFTGETVSDVLAAILEREPPWEALPDATPPRLRSLLERCLRKDAERRLHSIADARIELEDLEHEPETAPTHAAGSRPRIPFAVSLALAALVAAVIGFGLGLGGTARERDPTPPRVVRTEISLSEGVRLAGANPPAVLAPDSSAIVFTGAPPGEASRLYLRSLASFETVLLPGTENAERPFFSPDGRWIGYYGPRALWKVSREGGPPVELCEVEDAINRGASWGPDGRILLPLGVTRGLGAIPESGGAPVVVTEPDAERGELSHWFPRHLPNGRSVLLTVRNREGWHSAVLDLESGTWTHLEPPIGVASFLEPDLLLWSDGPTVMAQRFDLEKRRPKGSIAPVLGETWSFVTSRDGSLLYETVEDGRRRAARRVVRLAADGSTSVTPVEPGRYQQAVLSPDGRRVALVEGSRRLWIADLERGTRSPVEIGGTLANFPVWSPDGERIAFNALGAERTGIFVRSLTSTGPPELLVERQGNEPMFPITWHPSGRTLLYIQLTSDRGTEVRALDLDDRSTELLLGGPGDQHSPTFSPDGRWLAWVTDESGREEIYLQTWPLETGERSTVSPRGGVLPRWSPDSHELYYLEDRQLRVVSIEPGPDSRPRISEPRPERALPNPPEFSIDYQPIYDLAPDGETIVTLSPDETLEEPPFRLILNAATEFGRKVDGTR